MILAIRGGYTLRKVSVKCNHVDFLSPAYHRDLRIFFYQPITRIILFLLYSPQGICFIRLISWLFNNQRDFTDFTVDYAGHTFRVQLTEYRVQLPCGMLFSLKGIYPPAKGNALYRVQLPCGALMTSILFVPIEYNSVQDEKSVESFPPFPSHLSPFISHLSSLTFHRSPFPSPLSPFTFFLLIICSIYKYYIPLQGNLC